MYHPANRTRSGGATLPSERRTTGWIIAIASLAALALRCWFARVARIDRPVRGDALDYVSYAVNLVLHHTFSVASGTAPPAPDSYRDPGYPLFLAPFIALIADPGLRYWMLQLAQASLGALTVTAYLLLARRWLTRPWLIVTAVLLAIWPHSLTMPAYLVSETLFGFLVAVGLWLVTSALRSGDLRMTAAGGTVFGLAGLTNAVVAPFLPLVAIAGLFAARSRRRQFTVLLAASLLLPLAWNVRNLTLDAQVPTSGQRAMTNLVQGSEPHYHSAWLGAVRGEASAQAESAAIDAEVARAVADRDAGLRAIASRIEHDPLTYLGWYASKPALLWDWSLRIGGGHLYVFPTLDSPLEANVIAWNTMYVLGLINPWLAGLALLACILLVTRRMPRTPLLVAALLLYVTAVYGVLQSEPRYAVPFRGAEIVLATTAAAWLVRRLGLTIHKVRDRTTTSEHPR